MTRLLSTVLLTFFVAAGCSESESGPGPSSTDDSHVAKSPTRRRTPPAPAQLSPAAIEEATKIFQTRCTPCHGAEGRGDGATSKGLTPPPRNLTDAAWQSQVDDAYIERVITVGGMGVGKSPAMPPNPDLADKPEVIKALRARIRNLRH